jgi:hypothetical protein
MVRQFFKKHFEWLALSAGLIIIALMNPYEPQGTTWCLLEWGGITYCPGEGLGHSIAYSFRGDFANAMSAHILGPATVLILGSRITYLLKQNFTQEPIKPD